jgi:hypothetical protein
MCPTTPGHLAQNQQLVASSDFEISFGKPENDRKRLAE